MADRDMTWPHWDAVSKAAKGLGTPLYVYLPDQAAAAFRLIEDGARAWGTCAVAYSLKTNYFHPLLVDLRRLGSWIEVVSGWEYDLAVRAGFRQDTIVFNGPLKRPKDIENAALGKAFTINIDSTEELDFCVDVAERLKHPIRVGVRVCPPRQNARWSRFGLSAESGELDYAIAMVRKHPLLNLVCLHMHIGTQIQSPEAYFATLSFARSLWERLGLEASVWLDIGGGFPFRHDLRLDQQPFVPLEFFGELGARWGANERPPLLIEPGRWIAASAFATVSTVIAHKQRPGEPTIVVLDSGTNHNVMAAFYEHEWVFGTELESVETFRLCGPLCMEDDNLSGPKYGRPPAVGSLVVALNAGAYSLSLSRTFIQARPSIVCAQKTGDPKVLELRETVADLYGARQVTLGD